MVGYRNGHYPTRGEPLSGRERQALQLLANGYSLKEIAIHMQVAHETVKSHMRNIHKKLDTTNTQGTVAEGFRLGLVE